MELTIKELNKQWISKTLIYKALKNSLPFSFKMVKNKRVFNEIDLEILKLFRKHWKEHTVKLYWKSNNINKKTVLEKQQDSFENKKQLIETVLNNPDNKRINYTETELKQLETVKTELNREIEQKNKIIEIKDNQNQTTAIRLRDEKKEKEGWIEKYDTVSKEKEDWIKWYFKIKSYLIAFILLFLLFSILLFLVVINIVSFNI